MQGDGLLLVFEFICALNPARSDAIAMGQGLNQRDDATMSPDQAMGDRANIFMIQYTLTDSVNSVVGDFTLEQVNSNIQRARLAHCVWEWAKTLQWPDENQNSPPMAKWGVTWFEQ